MKEITPTTPTEKPLTDEEMDAMYEQAKVAAGTARTALGHVEEYYVDVNGAVATTESDKAAIVHERERSSV